MSATQLPKVLIIADDDDVHAQALCRHYEAEKSAEAYLLNSAHFPQQVKLTYTTLEQSTILKLASGRVLVEEEITGIWYRRPKPHEIDRGIREDRARKFAAAESRALFQGWLCRCGNKVVNPVAADRLAHFKPLQLAKARSVGLNVPDTLISNDQLDVAEFLDRWDKRVIFKILTTTPWQVTETKSWKSEYDSMLGLISLAPVIWQQRIERGRDFRVTVIDNDVAVAEIIPDRPNAQLDWRLDVSARVIPAVLSNEVCERLLRLTRELGLRYGAIDLREDNDGKMWFFEVNPGGQFLFKDVHGNIPVLPLMAKALARSTGGS
ncbi:MvdC/MvdD family ATP grasp protein [Pseudomonas sp. R37(2017)]|uniref:MvdC/MvdD family ATP grasp protein n=1 Tax=Pseudomonas sp. R37(2017) TaxID=1981685 RepID=UPI000A1EA9C9|nr:hypothetical protein [Pseudomonas sp. R37(2017)]